MLLSHEMLMKINVFQEKGIFLLKTQRNKVIKDDSEKAFSMISAVFEPNL